MISISLKKLEQMHKHIILLTLPLFIGCMPQKKGENTNLSFTNDSIITTTKAAEIKAYYPVFDNQYADSVIKTLVNQQIELFKETAGEEPISENWTNELNIQFEVAQYNEHLVTVVLDQYCFTGGAHGNTLFSKVVMDLKQRRIRILTDFFKGDPLASIQAPVRKQLKAQIDFHDFIDDGTATLKDFEVFSLNDSTITFYFTPYQVAPYAYGSQKVSLPLHSLPDFKKPE